MIIGTMIITIHLPWVHSLKEKRMVVKSLCAKIHNKFNVSIAEVAEQDTHQTLVLGISSVAGDTSQADSILDHVLQFAEGNTEGEIVKVERELL
jgi:uncharacterized protein YlxP (DUF503 family)